MSQAVAVEHRERSLRIRAFRAATYLYPPFSDMARDLFGFGPSEGCSRCPDIAPSAAHDTLWEGSTHKRPMIATEYWRRLTRCRMRALQLRRVDRIAVREADRVLRDDAAGL